MPSGAENIRISPKKVIRDLVILIPLCVGIGYGTNQLGWFKVHPPAKATDASESGDSGSPASTANGPEAVIAQFDQTSQEPLVVIDGQEFTRGDIDKRAFRLFDSAGREPDQGLKPSIQADFLRVQVFFDLTRDMAEQRAAEGRNLIPTDAEVAAGVAKARANFANDAAYHQGLAAMGTDEVGMQSLTRRNLQKDMLRKTVLKELGVDESDPNAGKKYDDWLTKQMGTLKVDIKDPKFRESMATLIQMIQSTPQHAGVQGANPHGSGMPADHPSINGENAPMDSAGQ